MCSYLPLVFFVVRYRTIYKESASSFEDSAASHHQEREKPTKNTSLTAGCCQDNVTHKKTSKPDCMYLRIHAHQYRRLYCRIRHSSSIGGLEQDRLTVRDFVRRAVDGMNVSQRATSCDDLISLLLKLFNEQHMIADVLSAFGGDGRLIRLQPSHSRAYHIPYRVKKIEDIRSLARPLAKGSMRVGRSL
jgi:hypothetical protein